MFSCYFVSLMQSYQKRKTHIYTFVIYICVNNKTTPIFQFIVTFLWGTLFKSLFFSKRSALLKLLGKVSDFFLTLNLYPEQAFLWGLDYVWVRRKVVQMIKQYPWEKTINMYKGLSLQYKYQHAPTWLFRAFLMYICR